MKLNDLTIILKRHIMKMYSYCLSFKWTNYLKACEREGMGIDDLRIPCLTSRPRTFFFLSFVCVILFNTLFFFV